jgi:hypothetical protein
MHLPYLLIVSADALGGGAARDGAGPPENERAPICRWASNTGMGGRCSAAGDRHGDKVVVT